MKPTLRPVVDVEKMLKKVAGKIPEKGAVLVTGLSPTEHPEAVLILSAAVSSCNTLLSTSDAKSFSRCIEGAGKSDVGRVERAMSKESVLQATACWTGGKLKVYGTPADFRTVMRKASEAKGALEKRRIKFYLVAVA